MITVYTLVSSDGVIGLNGKQYLLDEDGELLTFESEEDARQFIEDNGEDADNEFIEYEEVTDEQSV